MQHSDIVLYFFIFFFLVIVIFSCTNTTAFHMRDCKFSEEGRLVKMGKGVRKGGGLGLKSPLNFLCYKNVITYAKEFVYAFVHFLLV